jgi:ACT domain-containing protein
MTAEPRSDGSGNAQAYTVRLELVDEPGELLHALEPIASAGGNLLSIYHERGNVTPRGDIPVEVDLECHPDQFEAIVDALRDAGINVIQAGAERYTEEVTVLLIGHLIDTDLSDTLSQLETTDGVSVADIAVSAPEGVDQQSSARLRLATATGQTGTALDAVHDIAAEKSLRVVEPQLGGETE